MRDMSAGLDFSAVMGEIALMGPKFGPSEMLRTRTLFRELVLREAWGQAPLVADIPYGSEMRHRLDIVPAEQGNSPVVIFLHGGGFIAGDKNSDETFYCNVPRYFAAHGYMGVAANYRLADVAGWPAGAEDLAQIVGWVREHAGKFGGDPDRICLLGQSAGAAHVATWLFDAKFKSEHAGAIKAAALMSGFYEPRAPLAGGPLLYFGDNERLYVGRAVTTHVAPGHMPLLLTLAQYDPAAIAEQTLLLSLALNQADGCPPRLVWCEGQNHVSGVHGLGLGDDPVGRMLREFFASSMASAATA